ncbi:MAG: hypothetical protein OES24_06450 [Acidimicrobiia bacterium]|nr:hypothetical protein [Acidimicrobiia bacterium]
MTHRWAIPTAVGAAVILGVLVTTSFSWFRGGQTSAATVLVASGADSVEVERVMPVGDLTVRGVVDPAGLAMTADGRNLYLTDAAEPGTILAYSTDGSPGEPERLTGRAAPARAIAVDPTTREPVVALDTPPSIEWLGSGRGPFASPADDVEIASAFSDGLAFDQNRGLIHGLSRGVISSFLYDPESKYIGAVRQQIDVSMLVPDGAVGGLSADPVTGSLYLGLLDESTVFEIDRSGDLVRVLDLSRVGVEPVAFTVASSSDPADLSGSMSVFVVAGSRGPSPSTTIVELGTVPVETIGVDIVDTAQLVQTVSMADIPSPSPDSSATAWLPDQGKLIIADSEVDEYDIFVGVNTWTIDPADGPGGSIEVTGSLPSGEPTGLAVDGNRIFITDDVAKEIDVVDLGSDGVVSGDDSVISRFTTLSFGSADPEGVAFDALRGRLYVVDGSRREVFVIDPGPNELFEGAGDDIVTRFDVAGAGLADPEGIAYEPERDTFVIVDRQDAMAVEFGPDGGVLRRIDLSAADAVHLAGVTWAPGSSGGTSLWAVDRGLDGPVTVDGRVYEFSVPPLANGSSEPSISVPRSLVGQRSGSGESTRLTVNVENRGAGPLRLKEVRVHGVDDGAVRVVSESVPAQILAAGRSEIDLIVAPGADVPPGSRLVIESSDPNRPRTTVKLVVQG